MNNFELKISFKLGFCLGFANIYSQTNKLLSVLTLHCTVYTIQCKISTDSSWFVWLYILAEPKQMPSSNEICNSKLLYKS